MKKLFIVILVTALAQLKVNAQGCVAVRQMGGMSMCSSNGYNLSKGSLQVGTNYRYFHSWRHFVGTEEQTERQETGGGHGPDGKDRGNAGRPAWRSAARTRRPSSKDRSALPAGDHG